MITIWSFISAPALSQFFKTLLPYILRFLVFFRYIYALLYSELQQTRPAASTRQAEPVHFIQFRTCRLRPLYLWDRIRPGSSAPQAYSSSGFIYRTEEFHFLFYCSLDRFEAGSQKFTRVVALALLILAFFDIFTCSFRERKLALCIYVDLGNAQADRFLDHVCRDS